VWLLEVPAEAFDMIPNTFHIGSGGGLPGCEGAAFFSHPAGGTAALMKINQGWFWLATTVSSTLHRHEAPTFEEARAALRQHAKDRGWIK